VLGYTYPYSHPGPSLNSPSGWSPGIGPVLLLHLVENTDVTIALDLFLGSSH